MKDTIVTVSILLLRALALITMWYALVVHVKDYYGWGLFITFLLASVTYNSDKEKDNHAN